MSGSLDPIGLSVQVAWGLLLLGLVLALYRLWRGPTAADRVLALDLTSYFAIGLVMLRAIATSEEHPLHAALVLALLAFIGTVIFGRFLERRGRSCR